MADFEGAPKQIAVTLRKTNANGTEMTVNINKVLTSDSNTTEEIASMHAEVNAAIDTALNQS